MGLSRNKVAVPEGAAGTPPFWSDDSWIKDVVGAIKRKQYFKVRRKAPRLLVLAICFQIKGRKKPGFQGPEA